MSMVVARMAVSGNAIAVDLGPADGQALQAPPPLRDGDEGGAASHRDLVPGVTMGTSRPPWVEVKEGFDFCTLCHVFATDGHLASERHRKRLEWYEWSAALGRVVVHDPHLGPPEIWGEPAHFEWREGWWWCRLCARWADSSHVQGKRHQKRHDWADWYMSEENSIRSDTSSSMAAIGPEEDGSMAAISSSADTGFISDGSRPRRVEPWGPRWQAAVKARAAPVVANPALPAPGQAPHADEAAASVSYSAPDPLGSASEAQPRRPPIPVVLGDTPWRREWSEDHQQSYFWNELTGERHWHLPDTYTGGVAEVEWC